jgi:hypothetical protein
MGDRDEVDNKRCNEVKGQGEHRGGKRHTVDVRTDLFG